MALPSQDQIAYYRDHGYVHIPRVFTDGEMDELDAHLDFLMDQWASTEMGWTGPWRQVYMDADTEKKSKLTHLHDLHLYSAAWLRAVTHPTMVAVMRALIGENVELHHTTLHAKPPQTGHPFPMHQDMAFYEHSDDRYVDALIHLDDTCHENGEIRFLDGSHKEGYLRHVTRMDNGEDCSPHLPTDRYRIEDSVPAPAERGDVVCFNINTVHGSHINQTQKVRRMVRCGYRDPENLQISGQSHGRPGIIVSGLRIKKAGQQAFSGEAVA